MSLNLEFSTDINVNPKRAEIMFQKFLETVNSDGIGFFNLDERTDLISQSEKIFKAFIDKTHFVQIGIGGSSLGPEMLISSLKETDCHFEFINNIDPDQIERQLKKIDLKNTLFYVVSKSGGTAETVAGFSIMMNLLKENGISESEFKDYFVFATDPVNSQLLTLSKELDIKCLEVPSNIGGRFSVLTPVGYLPCLFAGVDPKDLLKGHADLKTEVSKFSSDNPLITSAEWLFNLFENGVNQTVIMPYSSTLRDLAFWYVQLWAESLGKKVDRSGKEVNTGFTPIPGYGATDQHSQMQLFMEGPYDKALMLVEVEKFKHDFKLESTINLPSFEKLKNHSLVDLMKAELNGTKKALKEVKRPFINLKIDQVDAYHMGQLIVFFEALTALMGEYLDIDAFNQPGVELGKVYAYEILAQS